MEIAKKIRKVVLREDFMAITDDCKEAIVLNQFLYWAERVKDADKLIEQENEIARRNGELEKEPLYGWIYKTAEQMAEETLLGMNSRTVGRYMQALVDKGFIDRRNNPKYKWDRTYQYRFNFINVALALKEKGYPFSGYEEIIIPETLTKPIIPHSTKTTHHSDNMSNQEVEKADAIPRNYNTEITSKNYVKCSMVQNSKSICTNDYSYEIVIKQIKKICRDIEVDSELPLRVILYYCEQYERYMGKHHPKMRNNHYETVIRNIVYNDYDFMFEDFELMIDKHFVTDYGEEIDYNMLHFFTDGILENRMYETCY